MGCLAVAECCAVVAFSMWDLHAPLARGWEARHQRPLPGRRREASGGLTGGVHGLWQDTVWRLPEASAVTRAGRSAWWGAQVDIQTEDVYGKAAEAAA